MLGGEAIVWRENAKAVLRKPDGDGTVGLRGATEVAAAVQVQHDSVGETGRFDPFAWNPINARRSDAYGGWDFVRKRPKNCAGDTIIAAAFEASFDAPLGKPNREMGLKTGHEGGALQ